MSEVLGANGNELTITIPSSGERDWATSIRDNCFQKISDHSHEGSGLGKKLKGYLAIDQTEAILANNTTMKARDNAGSATIDVLKVDANDEVVISTTVASADFQDDGLTVSDNADNTKKLALQLSGITTGNTRTLTVPDASDTIAVLALAQTLTNKTIDSDNNTITNIVNADIKAAAAIALNKLAATTASRALVSDGSGFVSASSVTSTELGYVSGVTSAIQTQIDTKTDTGTANEITLTGTVIGLADNPVVPGTDSMVVPVGTTAQRSSTTDGAFRFNSTLNQFEGYKSSAWSSIGGGGGGLDIFHDEDFAVTAASDFTTGQNATPDAAGTGTLGGTLGEESSTQLAGTKSLKFTMNATASSSDNDFFLNDADIALEVKQQANFLGIDFYYTYDGADDDIRFFVLDDSDNELTLSNEYLKSASTATRFSTSIYVGSAVTGIRYGFQVVSGNSSKVLLIDDVQITTNPFVYKNLTETDSARYNTHAGFGSTNTKIPYFTNEVTNNTGSVVTLANDSTNGFSITANKKCIVNITYSAAANSANYGNIGFSLDSSQLTTAINSITVADRVSHSMIENASGAVDSITATIEMNANEVLRPHTDGDGQTAASAAITLTATATAEHVITPAKSNVNTFSAKISNNGTAAIVTQGGKDANGNNAIASVNRTAAGKVTVTFTSSFFSVAPAVVVAADNNSGVADYYASVDSEPTTSSCAVWVATNGGAGTDRDFWITIHRQGADEVNATYLAAVPTNVQNNATDFVSESGITIEGTTSNPTKPTTMDTDKITWAQHGQNLKAYYKYYAASVTGSAAGSGDYLFTLPNGLSFDSNVVDFYTTVEGSGAWQIANGQIVGYGYACDGSSENTQVAVPYDATRFRVFGIHDASGTGEGAMSSAYFALTTAETFSMVIDAPIDGWTSAGTFLSATPKNETAYVKDVKSAGTSGGTFTLGAWRTRDLNDLSGDTSWISISSNQFTLDAGKYQIECNVPAYRVDRHQALLYNITDASNEIIGTSAEASQSNTVGSDANIYGVVDISSSKTFEVRHQSSNTQATNGFGNAANFGVDEIYTQVKITKIP